MAHLITQVSLLGLRLTWGYILVNDIKILNLPPHLEHMLYGLYVALILFKAIIVFGKVKPSDDHHAVLAIVNGIMFGILILACVVQFVHVTDFGKMTSVLDNLVHCLILAGLFVAGEKLFDLALGTRTIHNSTIWKTIINFLIEKFSKDTVTEKENAFDRHVKKTRSRTKKSFDYRLPQKPNRENRRKPPQQEDNTSQSP